MGVSIRILILLISGLFSVAGLYSCAAGNKEKPHVIVIGVDGMSPDGIRQAATPVMDKMMEGGAWTLQARCMLPSSSSTNWASMIMGASVSQHGITSNEWERDDHVLPPVVTGSEDIFPTIFGVLRQQRPQAEIGAVYHWEGFGRLFEKSAVNYNVHCDNEIITARTAAQYIMTDKPDFLFIHLDHVDGVGHHFGHGSREYYQSVSRADSLIGLILDATASVGILNNTLFIVTADHGGIGFGHGGETPAEVEIPFILYGRGIKNGHLIKIPVMTYDNAATVAFALGIEVPYAWIGRPLKGAFKGYDEPAVSGNMLLPAEPDIEPDLELYAAGGGLFRGDKPIIRLTHENQKAEIYYTTDGSEPTRSSILYTKPFTAEKTMVLQARAFLEKDSSQVINAPFRIVSEADNPGISYQYFEGGQITSCPGIAGLDKISEGKTAEFSLAGLKHRPEQFAYVMESELTIHLEGEYKFYTRSDDGSRLFVNDQLVVNNDGDHGTEEKSGKVWLKNGSVRLRLEYFNAGGGHYLEVLYRGPGIVKQPLPPHLLRTT